MRRRQPPRDPYWITTKYPGKGADGTEYPAGSRAFYHPNSNTTLFGPEAEAASARFDAEKADEANYSAGYG